MALPPLVRLPARTRSAPIPQVHEASARAARLEVRIGEIEATCPTSNRDDQTQTEPLPPLSPERERALGRLTAVDRAAAPLYRHLDLAREGVACGEAIEGLLDHLDVLTLLTVSLPLE